MTDGGGLREPESDGWWSLLRPKLSERGHNKCDKSLKNINETQRRRLSFAD